MANEEPNGFRGRVPSDKDTLWWNEERKRTIKNKRMSLKIENY